MKNIYMVQPNSQYGNSVYLPYAAGSLVAYAFANEKIADNYRFKGFIYKKNDDIDFLVDRMENPAFVGFSCYVWNYEFNKVLARKIKEKYPKCHIAFGGHQVNKESDIIDCDYVDSICFGEGEENFKNLMLSLIDEGDFDEIPNFIYRCDNENFCPLPEPVNVNIPQRVSPYLTGLFDNLFEEEELEFSAILETNRGCPNRCAFCDWGNIKSRVILYDIDLVKKEIDWMSAHKIEYCYCADANFGLFPRDEEIISYIIESHNKTGYPKKFQATYSKNNAQTVYRINKLLNDAGMSKGATLSFQSMNDEVLKNINRENMPLSKFRELITLYNNNGIDAYSEIILGMPGETYDTLKTGIEELLEYGQHQSINFFNCELLPNSIMNTPEYRSKYKIEYAVTQQHQYHVVPTKSAIQEYSKIVVSTSSMDKNMWIDCNILTVFVRSLHNLGLLQCVAIYLYYEKSIKYMDFYEKIIEFAIIKPNSVIGTMHSWLKRKYFEVTQNSGSLTYTDAYYGELSWPLEEGMFLRIVKNYNKFYEEIEPIIADFFENKLIFEELMNYQKAIIKTPYEFDNELKLDYDFFEYFSAIFLNKYHSLKKIKHVLKINIEKIPKDPPTYAREIIWFGRRGGTNINKDVTYFFD